MQPWRQTMVYDIWTTKINGKEKTIKPYGVLLETWDEVPTVYKYFKNEGFNCCWWDGHYKCILINLDLKKYGTISKACQFPMVGGNPMTIDDFLNKIFKPWKEQRGEVFVEYNHVPDPNFDVEDDSYCDED